MDDNNIRLFHLRQQSEDRARMREVLEREQEISELRHVISVMAVELVSYRERYG